MAVKDVLIIGAGPAGLATAIAAKQRGLDYLVLEKGVLVNSIYGFPSNMVFFTTPELLEIGGIPFVSPFDKPTRLEALRYYRRIVDTFDLAIEFDRTVTSIGQDGRDGDRRFTLETRSAQGERRLYESRAVVVAIGYYDHPNELGVPGERLPHVSHYYKDSHTSYRKRVVVVGGKNSAAEVALELYRGGAQVTLVHRRAQLASSIKYWVKPDIENRIAEGTVAARFETEVVEIRPDAVVVRPTGAGGGPVEQLPADAVFLMTGYHADWEFLREAGLTLDPATRVPTYDTATYETNVANLFVAGGVVAGRDTAPIFIENGRFHGEAIAGVLAERLARQPVSR
jgi:thioredoxin reductase (NADPH)